jgi:hypothetical protein
MKFTSEKMLGFCAPKICAPNEMHAHAARNFSSSLGNGGFSLVKSIRSPETLMQQGLQRVAPMEMKRVKMKKAARM